MVSTTKSKRKSPNVDKIINNETNIKLHTGANRNHFLVNLILFKATGNSISINMEYVKVYFLFPE